MKIITALMLSCVSAFSNPLSVIGYNGTTDQSPVKQGTVEIIMIPKSFTGTIGNTGSITLQQPLVIMARQDGDTLNDLSYTVPTPTLSILEVR